MTQFRFTTGITPIRLEDHSARHENGGDDEINVEGLSGLLADAQHVLSNEIDYGLSFEGIITTIDDSTHFRVATLADKGMGAFKTASGTPYEIYVFQADGAAPEGEQTPVVAYTSTGGIFEHAFGDALEEGDVVLIQHPLIASLGTKATAAALGAVTTTDYLMAYIKQLVNGLGLDGDAAYVHDYSKTTVAGWLHGFHAVRRILFVVPETLSNEEPTNDHNKAIKAELDAIGLVKTITQTDAIMYPDYESITLVVLGSPQAGTAWDTANLADIKKVFGLPVLCVDGDVAQYLAMGTNGTNASSKTILRAITNIKATILGMGQDNDTGLAIGVNTVAAEGVTFATLDMSGTETEIWYAYENDNNNTDILIGEIRQSMPDGTVGLDSGGFEVPGTLAFYGCAYSMNSLNTLGKAVLHLYVEKLTHSSTAGLAVLLSGNVGSLVNTIGNKRTAAATGAVGTGTKMMGYVKQLVTALILVLADTADMQPKLGTPAADVSADIAALKGIVDTITGRVTAAVATASSLSTHNNALTAARAVIDAIKTIVDTPANFMADVSGITTSGPTLSQMNTAHGLLATPAQVATALNTYDAVKRSEATSDKDEILGMIIAFGG